MAKMTPRFKKKDILELYRLERFVGFDEFGENWIGTHRENQEQVVIKIPNDTTFINALKESNFIIWDTSHSRILNTLEIQTETTHPFLVTEYFDSRNLRAILSEQQVLPIVKSMDICEQILESLRYAHNYGVVHHFLNPETILVNQMGEIKVTHFDLSNLHTIISEKMNPDAAVPPLLRNLSSYAKSYIAPEVDRVGVVDPRNNLYSLGRILFEMVTGIHKPDDIAGELEQSEIPKELSLIILKSTVRLEKRYDCATSMHNDLIKALITLRKSKSHDKSHIPETSRLGKMDDVSQTAKISEDADRTIAFKSDGKLLSQMAPTMDLSEIAKKASETDQLSKDVTDQATSELKKRERRTSKSAVPDSGTQPLRQITDAIPHQPTRKPRI